VAAHAGVSKSVVSRTLQGSAKVSAKSRQAVEKAIRELGYRPNGIARSLSQRRTGTIGVLAHDLRQPWFVDVLDGLHATLSRHGLRTLIGDGRQDLATGGELLKTFMEMRFDGLVLVGTMPLSPIISEAAEWIPTVVAGSRDFDLPRVDVIAEDDWLGVELVLDHLFELGHSSIAHIGGGKGKVFEVRQASYCAWMESHGLAGYIQAASCDASEEDSRLTALGLLRGGRNQAPTAIFCDSDLMGVGVLDAARDLGMRVPEDLSVASFDNSSLAHMGPIQLTSVDIAPRAVGMLAGEWLIRRMGEPMLTATEYLVRPTLVARSSTSTPRAV
jgi:DNA-binding LacI/PurR family transcriptional regulator